MDPIANVTEQMALARRLLDAPDDVSQRAFTADAERLAELVLALDEWRIGGGFDPYVTRQLAEADESVPPVAEVQAEHDRPSTGYRAPESGH